MQPKLQSKQLLLNSRLPSLANTKLSSELRALRKSNLLASKAARSKPSKTNPLPTANNSLNEESLSKLYVNRSQDLSCFRDQQASNFSDLVKLEELLNALDSVTTKQGVLQLSNLEKGLDEFLEAFAELSTREFDEIFKDFRAQRIVSQALIVDITAVYFLKFYIQQPFAMYNQVKSLVTNMHTNSLYLMQAVLGKLGRTQKVSSLANSLNFIIKTHKMRPMSTGDAIKNIQATNEFLLSCMSNLCRSVLKYDKKVPLIKTIVSILKNTERSSLFNIRDPLAKSYADTLKHAKFSNPSSLSVPYIKTASEKEYTLVLDLDETLVHYQETHTDAHFYIRPGTDEFLNELGKHYEIIIFTAAIQDVSIKQVR